MINMNYQKITIIYSRKPSPLTLNQKLQWFANSLGLFNLRDRDNSCFRIFIELLKSAKHNKTMTSDELAEHLSLTRGTIVHHLNKLMESGLIVADKNKYYLRVSNLKELVSEIEKDVTRTLSDLKGVADEIDSQLGL